MKHSEGFLRLNDVNRGFYLAAESMRCLTAVEIVEIVSSYLYSHTVYSLLWSWCKLALGETVQLVKRGGNHPSLPIPIDRKQAKIL